MSIKYSKSTGGFYDPLHNANIPADAVDVSDLEHQSLLEGQAMGNQIVPNAEGRPVLQPIPGPTDADRVRVITDALQAELDRVARTHGYDGILSACSYAAQPAGAPFKDEGDAFVAWRSQVWAEAYQRLNEFKAGTAGLPTPADAVALMPPLVLPVVS